MTINDIIEFESDTVSIATGAKWRNDWIGSTNFEEIKTKSHNLLTPDDIMSNKTSNISPSSFIVYDDDHYYMASVITEKLLKDGHSVTYVTPLPTISTWTQYTLEQVAITEKLRSLGANFILNCKMTQNQGFLNLIDNKNFEINIKNLVFVGAKSSNNELFRDKKLMNSIKNIFLTGDCLAPRTIQAAVLSGHQVARDILNRENKPKPLKREQTIH